MRQINLISRSVTRENRPPKSDTNTQLKSFITEQSECSNKPEFALECFAHIFPSKSQLSSNRSRRSQSSYSVKH